MRLEVIKASAGYGAHEIIHDVSLLVESGETIALVGPNGAGKSTVLRTIMRLTQFGRGDVLLDGKRVNGTPTYDVARLGLGYVAEGHRIFGRLSVRDNLVVSFGGPARRQGFSSRLAKVLDLFPDLLPRLSHQAGDLSGGQQQMLAIASALMKQPGILLLDEPSLGLAPFLVDEVYDVLKRLAGTGLGMVVVEQQIERVLGMSKRAYVLADGKVVLSGASEVVRGSKALAEAYFGGETDKTTAGTLFRAGG